MIWVGFTDFSCQICCFFRLFWCIFWYKNEYVLVLSHSLIYFVKKRDVKSSDFKEFEQHPKVLRESHVPDYIISQFEIENPLKTWKIWAYHSTLNFTGVSSHAKSFLLNKMFGYYSKNGQYAESMKIENNFYVRFCQRYVTKILDS